MTGVSGAKRRQRPGAHKKRCKHGHEMTPENTRFTVSSRTGHERRICRACVRERDRERYWLAKALQAA